jgi:hypothetical protein
MQLLRQVVPHPSFQSIFFFFLSVGMRGCSCRGSWYSAQASKVSFSISFSISFSFSLAWVQEDAAGTPTQASEVSISISISISISFY